MGPTSPPENIIPEEEAADSAARRREEEQQSPRILRSEAFPASPIAVAEVAVQVFDEKAERVLSVCGERYNGKWRSTGCVPATLTIGDLFRRSGDGPFVQYFSQSLWHLIESMQHHRQDLNQNVFLVNIYIFFFSLFKYFSILIYLSYVSF
ncbi:hypothetical protein HAX54_027962 [Datura stramonium]|uniref:Uncharacterized protein n=1 Tax=Datura stramonium TaxID=4076 RepID=A0ABS8V5E3_DATST|nr:hypothetical protein [Datura stramonium]